jgi:ABC-type lipoprotein release transport system permease subunit
LTARYASAVLFGIQVGGFLAYVGAAALVIVVSLAATLLPARRAASVDPNTVLRHE